VIEARHAPTRGRVGCAGIPRAATNTRRVAEDVAAGGHSPPAAQPAPHTPLKSRSRPTAASNGCTPTSRSSRRSRNNARRNIQNDLVAQRPVSLRWALAARSRGSRFRGGPFTLEAMVPVVSVREDVERGAWATGSPPMWRRARVARGDPRETVALRARGRWARSRESGRPSRATSWTQPSGLRTGRDLSQAAACSRASALPNIVWTNVPGPQFRSTARGDGDALNPWSAAKNQAVGSRS